MRVIEKLFENWEQEILRPIATTLLTGLILFTVSLSFRPVRSFFFPPPTVEEYPLICTAEPYMGHSDEHLFVDFFIINRTGKEYSREDLASLLRTANPEPTAAPSPDIHLKYSRVVDGKPVGGIEQISLEEDFNMDKGRLRADRHGDTVSIVVDNIRERAVMRVTLKIVLPDLERSAVRRTAKVLVPFEFSRYEDACYTRQ